MRHLPTILFFLHFLICTASAETPYRYVGSFGESVRDEATTSTITYYAQGAMVRIVDNSNPTSPTQIGCLIFDKTIFQLAIRSNALYVILNSPDGCSIEIHDISDPRRPRLARSIPFGDQDRTERIRIELIDKILWLIEGTYHQHIGACFDIANPFNPIQFKIPSTYDEDGNIIHKAANGQVAYTIRDYELFVLDKNGPHPQIPVEDRLLNGLCVHGNTLYVVGAESLHVFDVSDQHKPRLAESIKLAPGDEGDRWNDLFITGSTLWVWTGDRYPRLRNIYDISNPLRPVTHPSIKPWPIPTDTPTTATQQKKSKRPFWIQETGFITDVDTTGSQLFVTNNSGLQIIDFSDPAKCLPIGSLKYAEAERVLRNGSLIYLSSDQPSFAVVDVSNPKDPTLVNDFDLATPIESMRRNGNYIFAAAGSAGFLVIDIANPTSPTLVASHATASECRDVVVAGHYALIAAGKLQVLEVADPLHLKAIKDIDAGIEADKLFIHDHHLYVAGDEDQIGRPIFNISDPANPKLLPNRVKLFEYVEAGQMSPGQNLAQSGDMIVSSQYIREGSYGTYRSGKLIFFDIINPESPVERGSVTTPWGADKVFLKNNTLFVGDSEGGLMIYQK